MGNPQRIRLSIHIDKVEEDNMQNTYETFAAVAVFRELYDKGKDIYDVL